MKYKQFYAYDVNGDYLETILVFENENGLINQPKNSTDIEPTITENGISRAMYYPHWNGNAWEEDKARWELENPVIPQEKTEIEKLREELLLTQEALAALFESNLG
ncbi:hypothetical protein AFW95_08405 [Listeria monocytogenes]|nr:hypothetical protein [Listeria monocytogenes]EAD0271767.1 hypothetical protein [Listeria monocytogenes]EAF9608433.1 hypothetical protein [Listeria monocytogenes]